MKRLEDIFDSNKKWANRVRRQDPEFFKRLAQQQSPQFLWIGCADSRVPATQICGMDPGQMFVHRNIANLVVKDDLNCLSVIQYAVDVLKVTDIIVCGHYGCGGIQAALDDAKLGLIDGWLAHIKEAFQGQKLGPDQAVEINVVAQVHNLAELEIIKNAWKRGQTLSLHGVVYRLSDGLLKDLDVNICAL